VTRVYLVRHGTHALVGKALAGRMGGVHLLPEGQAEAGNLGRHFADRDVTAVLSSPLDRCRETAQPIADRLALPVELSEALVEIDCGDWTGQSFEALSADPRWHAWNGERHRASVPGGETMADVQRRVMGLVETLAAADREPAILVSHSDVIKAVIQSLLGSPLERHDRLEIDPASITTVDLWPGGGKIIRMNEVLSS
jgi:broad specificity phosphatase PhoE